MATNVQRATAILKALQDAAPTSEQYDRAVGAFVRRYRTDRDPTTLADNDRAEALLAVLGGLVEETVYGVELRELQEQVRTELRPFRLRKEKQT